MAQPVPSKCPLHGGPVEVTEVSCTECDVQVRGHFTLSPYDQLAPEQQQFMETFLRCRGVIRDVEAALGISYPTVRGRLDGLLTALGFQDGGLPAAPEAPPAPRPDAPDKAARRKEILEAISAGAMDAETGLRALQNL